MDKMINLADLKTLDSNSFGQLRIDKTIGNSIYSGPDSNES